MHLREKYDKLEASFLYCRHPCKLATNLSIATAETGPETASWLLYLNASRARVLLLQVSWPDPIDPETSPMHRNQYQ